MKQESDPQKNRTASSRTATVTKERTLMLE